MRYMRHYLDLASKASNAAIAIDNHLLGRATQVKYQDIKTLSTSLYEIVKGYDPTSEMMMADTIWPNRKDWEGKTVEDTKLQTWLFARDLSVLTEFTIERQKELRSACLSLSRNAQRYSKSFILRLVA